MSRILKRIILSLCIILSFYFVYSCSVQAEAVPADTYNLQSSSAPATQIYNKNVHSMVYIKTQSAQGSGVIVDEAGTIVTCFYVIADADYINVKTQDGSTYTVNGFKYINPLTDVAILTLDAPFSKFVPISIDKDNIQVGEKVYTISSPKGLQFSFSDGMVNQYTDNYIQFSAPISTGSSGGALLDAQGNLIGIITSLLKQSQNINFALPNKFYVQQINNTTIKNIYNLKWTDFVASNASVEQFNLYTEYAIKENQYGLIYRYIKPYTILKDFPSSIYALIGACAMYDFFTNYQEQSKIDAIDLFEKSIRANKNIESSLLALVALYKLDNSRIHLYDKTLAILRDYFPYSYEQYWIFIDNLQYALAQKTDVKSVFLII